MAEFKMWEFELWEFTVKFKGGNLPLDYIITKLTKI